MKKKKKKKRRNTKLKPQQKKPKNIALLEVCPNTWLPDVFCS